eukprot:425661-Rhodomonas_salina.1
MPAAPVAAQPYHQPSPRLANCRAAKRLVFWISSPCAESSLKVYVSCGPTWQWFLHFSLESSHYFPLLDDADYMRIFELQFNYRLSAHLPLTLAPRNPVSPSRNPLTHSQHHPGDAVMMISGPFATGVWFRALDSRTFNLWKVILGLESPCNPWRLVLKGDAQSICKVDVEKMMLTTTTLATATSTMARWRWWCRCW